VERELAIDWMKFDGRLPYRLSTPWTWLIAEQVKGHDEFLFARGEFGTLKGVLPRCKDLGRFTTTPQSNQILRLQNFSVE
jgi:hypothetical protein